MPHPRLTDLIIAITATAFLFGLALYGALEAVQWCVAQVAAFGGAA